MKLLTVFSLLGLASLSSARLFDPNPSIPSNDTSVDDVSFLDPEGGTDVSAASPDDLASAGVAGNDAENVGAFANGLEDDVDSNPSIPSNDTSVDDVSFLDPEGGTDVSAPSLDDLSSAGVAGNDAENVGAFANDLEDDAYDDDGDENVEVPPNDLEDEVFEDGSFVGGTGYEANSAATSNKAQPWRVCQRNSKGQATGSCMAVPECKAGTKVRLTPKGTQWTPKGTQLYTQWYWQPNQGHFESVKCTGMLMSFAKGKKGSNLQLRKRNEKGWIQDFQPSFVNDGELIQRTNYKMRVTATAKGEVRMEKNTKGTGRQVWKLKQ